MLDPGSWFVLLVAVAAFALGHFAYELGVRPSSPARFVPLIERAFAKVALGVCAVGWVGVLLTEAGLFGRWSLVATLVTAAAALALAFARPGAREHRIAPRIRSGADFSPAILVLLIAIGVHLYLPAFDVRLEARDPGVYHYFGVQIADTGGVAKTDSLARSLSAEASQYFFPPRRGGPAPQRYIGFYMDDRVAGRVIPQALPLFPVWLAVGHLAGAPFAGSMAALLAIFSAIAFFFFVRRLLNPAVAALASVLLAGNFAQAWFARYSAAEIAVQAMLMVGCYALTLQRRHADPFFGLLTAAGFGLMMLAKAEPIVFLLPLAVLLATDAARGTLDRSAVVALWVPLGLLTLHSGVHAIGWLAPYYKDLVQQRDVSLATAGLVVFGGGTGYIALLFGLHRRANSPSGEKRRARVDAFLQATNRAGLLFRHGLTAAIMLLSVAGYWWWPRLAGRALAAGDSVNHVWDVYNLIEFAWVVTPFMFAVAVLGIVLLLHDRSAHRGTGAILGILLFVAALTLWHRQIVPSLMWAYRRWVAAVLPFGFLAAAYGCWRLLERGRAGVHWLLPSGPESRSHARLRAALDAGVVIAVLALLVSVARYQIDVTLRYAMHEELPGTAALLDELEAIFEPDSLVLFEPRTLRGLERFEIPLAIGGHRDVVRLPSPDLSPEMLRELTTPAFSERRPVYLVTTGYVNRPHIASVPAGEIRISTSRLAEHANFRRVESGLSPALPTALEHFTIVGRVYRLSPTCVVDVYSDELDIGHWDDMSIDGESLHAAEVDDLGRTYRWTKATAGFWLEGLPPDAQTVTIIADADDIPYGDRARPQSMDVYLEGRRLASFSLAPDWQEYVVPISGWNPSTANLGRAAPGSPDAADSSNVPFLELRTEAVRPGDFGGSDRRSLGLKVDRIVWGAQPARSER